MILQERLPAYRTPFFERLKLELETCGVDLTLIRSAPRDRLSQRGDEDQIAWADDVSGRTISILGHEALWQPLSRPIRSADLVIVEQASHLLINLRLLARQSLLHKPLALWGHGRDFSVSGAPTDSGERFKQWFSRRVHWWFPYNDLSAQVVRGLGFPSERITVVQNSTDTKTLQRLVRAVTPSMIDETHRTLGLGAGSVGLFVGGLSPEKNFDFLFAAADCLSDADPGFSLLIVGDGPERAVVERMVERRHYAHYLGNRFGADLARSFAVADALLVPSWAGLVLVDSFAAGVPVMPSGSQPHPPEISYVISGENGLLVEDDGSPVRYAERVAQFLDDPAERAALAAGCARAAETYSIESMARRFADGVLAALDTPSRLGQGSRGNPNA